MEICHRLTALPPAAFGRGSAVALGFFDGVHIGHRAVISAAVDCARAEGLEAAVFTFSLPAGHIMKGGRLITDGEKHRRIEELGADRFFEPPFEEFCDLSPEAFVGDVLRGMYNAKAVFCGDNFTFGKKAAGNVAALKALCAPLGIRVEVVPMALYKGETVSSTRIRAALAAGDIRAANAMLGRPYAIDFEVRHGKGLGHTLGMPTLNQVYPEGFAHPRYGVYVTRALVEGAWHPGATGFGERPTVNKTGEGATCETFLPGFSGQLYGERVTVEFLDYIAESRRFDSTDQLRDAVMGWARQAVAWFQKEAGTGEEHEQAR
ncbi:riboflavin biosynthesis protein RibF [Candidatus Allofournierella merdavium]|uniref:riboflavin biosynthesis protein RibF n=1 Tax=Candidatus Allofournierella merdavium TaxID=2838593 RepID=UPI00374ED69C